MPIFVTDSSILSNPREIAERLLRKTVAVGSLSSRSTTSDGPIDIVVAIRNETAAASVSYAVNEPVAVPARALLVPAKGLWHDG